MLVHILKSKIHRAKVTGGNVQYEGSMTIDEDFMDKVGLVPFEKILCSNMACCQWPRPKAHNHLTAVNTWAAFAGTDDDAVVDGDFAVLEDELQPVLKSLRKAGVNIVAIHSHMTHENPRILFMHYWGRGKAEELAHAVKSALDTQSK
jgi:aspartate 1-decarboxylase